MKDDLIERLKAILPILWRTDAEVVNDAIAEITRLRNQVAGLHESIGRDSAELRRLCQARDDYKRERDWARELLAKLEAAATWIPVTERMPEPLTDVLVRVTCHNPLHVLRFSESRNCWIEPGGVYAADRDEITHWMPMPKPPTEDA